MLAQDPRIFCAKRREFMDGEFFLDKKTQKFILCIVSVFSQSDLFMNGNGKFFSMNTEGNGIFSFRADISGRGRPLYSDRILRSTTTIFFLLQSLRQSRLKFFLTRQRQDNFSQSRQARKERQNYLDFKTKAQGFS